ncbi:cysteine desulfurase NifS [Oscillospiraceae bacterium LCP25S3_E10]|nr:cysteine desulfurase NifS [Ruminococcus sp.]MDD6448096.1 cysteine desulfurase NifS [Ruminococcus sp.]MDY2856705.1 cysteine desulfurase NifS [Oscillospiraceae bacterium]
MNRIYADNAATTALSPEVLQDMMPYLTTVYGNPSSMYSIGSEAQKAVELARVDVAEAINALPREIFFTSGGSESDNWAIKGVARALKAKGKNHIITSAFEHHAVLHTCDALKKEGFEITLLDVHSDGLVRPEELEAAIKDTTALVSIMYANNEIGTIQPIEELGAICRKHGVLFHTDAVQAMGNVPIDVKKQNIDLLSMTAHKLHGPKGCGALYIRQGVRPQILIDGGAQERGMRAGTENVAGIVGLASAVKRAKATMEQRTEKLTRLRNKLIDSLSKIERSRLNGDREKRLPGNINMCFEGIEGEALLLRLDLMGICASSGSACTSGSLDPSHVLLAIGLPHEIAHGSLRLSFSDETTEEDIDYIAKCVPQVVNTLRSMSPVWERIKQQEQGK